MNRGDGNRPGREGDDANVNWGVQEGGDKHGTSTKASTDPDIDVRIG